MNQIIVGQMLNHKFEIIVWGCVLFLMFGVWKMELPIGPSFFGVGDWFCCWFTPLLEMQQSSSFVQRLTHTIYSVVWKRSQQEKLR